MEEKEVWLAYHIGVYGHGGRRNSSVYSGDSLVFLVKYWDRDLVVYSDCWHGLLDQVVAKAARPV